MVQPYTLNQILKLFDLTKDTDHDLRFMALNDLNKIVTESPQQFSTYSRTTLVYANILIGALDDQHSEVQNQAVKCFVLLLPMLKTEDVLKFITKLMVPKEDGSSLIVSSVYTMAVKTILENLRLPNYESAVMLVNNLLPNLLNYNLLISKIDPIEILDHIIEHLGKYFNTDQVTKTYELLIQVEFNAENTISKASINGLGKLMKYLDDRQLLNILNLTNTEFNTNLQKYTINDDEYYHVHSLRLAILTVFFKVGNTSGGGDVNCIFSRVLDIVFQNLFLDKLDKPIEEDEFDQIFKIDQVRDDSLQCLETIVQRMPYELISPQLSYILNISNELLKYDPFHSGNQDGNGNGDDSGNESSSDSFDEDDFDISDNEEFDYEPEDEEENDYDLSWSLRKNSLRLIGKIVDQYPLSLKQIYKLKIFNSLIIKLSDKSMNVSNEVISTLTKIVSSTSKTGTYFTMTFYDTVSNNIKKRRSEDNDDQDVVMNELELSLDPFEFLTANSELLCAKVVDVLITEKNIPRFSTVLNLLSQLTNVLNGLPQDFVYQIVLKLRDLNNLTTSIESLKFYTELLRTNKLKKFGDQTPFIVEAVINAANETNNYELSLEGLSTAGELFDAISDDSQQYVDHDQILLLAQILAQRATSKNYSNEIKQKCIASLTKLIANYHSYTTNELSSLLEVYEQSLEYESLNEASISGLTNLVPLIADKFDLVILQRIVSKFIILLNLRSNELKSVILECLVNMARTEGFMIPESLVKELVSTIITILQKESATSLSGKQIGECLSIIGNFASSLDDESILKVADFLDIIKLIIPNIGKIDQDEILGFVTQITPNLNEPNLFDIVLQNFETVSSKEFRMVFPGILALIALALNLTDAIQNSENFIMTNLSKATSSELEFHILFLGFVGQKIKLSSGLDPFMQILEIPEDTNLKTAALTLIGNISIFDVKTYLPIILDKLSHNDLLTLSLRRLLEVKVIQNGRKLLPVAQGITDDDYKKIWNSLQKIATDKQDLKSSQAELNVIADCLTLITVLDISKVDVLIHCMDSTSSIPLKYTMVSMIKYFLNFAPLFSQHPITFDKYLSKLLEKSSLLIFNENLQLKQTAVQALITSLHNKPLLALPILVQLLSTIMEKELVIRKDYIDTIQIGPFKHKIDNALDLRKSIYEMIYTLMTTIENSNLLQTNTIQQSLNYFDILKVSIEKGLKDDNDVVQLSSLIIAKIVNLKPQLLFKDGDLLKAFKDRALKIINKKMKENDTKQVIEKQKESIKSIQNLISNIDNVFRSNGLQGGEFEEWRKFAFINGAIGNTANGGNNNNNNSN